MGLHSESNLNPKHIVKLDVTSSDSKMYEHVQLKEKHSFSIENSSTLEKSILNKQEPKNHTEKKSSSSSLDNNVQIKIVTKCPNLEEFNSSKFEKNIHIKIDPGTEKFSSSIFDQNIQIKKEPTIPEQVESLILDNNLKIKTEPDDSKKYNSLASTLYQNVPINKEQGNSKTLVSGRKPQQGDQITKLISKTSNKQLFVSLKRISNVHFSSYEATKTSSEHISEERNAELLVDYKEKSGKTNERMSLKTDMSEGTLESNSNQKKLSELPKKIITAIEKELNLKLEGINSELPHQEETEKCKTKQKCLTSEDQDVVSKETKGRVEEMTPKEGDLASLNPNEGFEETNDFKSQQKKLKSHAENPNNKESRSEQKNCNSLRSNEISKNTNIYSESPTEKKEQKMFGSGSHQQIRDSDRQETPGMKANDSKNLHLGSEMVDNNEESKPQRKSIQHKTEDLENINEQSCSSKAFAKKSDLGLECSEKIPENGE